MATDSKSGTVLFDRRQLYRPFLERLNPIGSAEPDLIVPREHDPRNAGEPPIHVAFANAAELSRGTQMALVGGIGSGKTTELLLTQKVLDRHSDAVNIFIDLADYADLTDINTGALLATAGMRLYSIVRARLKKAGKEVPGEIESANAKLLEEAFGKTEWVSEDAIWHDNIPEDLVRVEYRGLMKHRLPALHRRVADLRALLLSVVVPLLESDAQITLLVDGLDRLIQPEIFRQFVEQDLQALRGSGISVIIVAPLLFWYDKSRFLQDYFDLAKHIPAAAAGPEDSAFLKQILERRGALELMDRTEIASIAKYSGGVLRDLMTLARSAAEYAYRDDEDRIGRRHVTAAVKQLGNRYLVGLGNAQMRLLRQLDEDGGFPIDSPVARQLLVNRQVLEYFRGRRESFAVHRALAKVLPKPND